MKKYNFKFMISCIVFIIMILFLPNAIANDEKENPDNQLEISKMNSTINSFIEKNNLDVVQSLDDISNYYEKIKNQTRDEDVSLEANNLSKTALRLKAVFRTKNQNLRYENMYSNAIAASAAFFYTLKYYLSNELVLHFGDNTGLDSEYKPMEKNTVLSSSVYATIYNSTNTEGSSIFPSGLNTIDMDLHLAINKFNYYKTPSNRAVVIKDRYDFANSDDYGLDEAIISILVAGQNAGFLFPFYTVIEHSYSGTNVNQTKYFSIGSYDRIFEDVTTLGQEEYVDYFITFPYSGEKIIQTFGCKDTYLYVYNPNGQVISAIDDGGYMLNSFLNCNLEAGIQYMIRVMFVDSSEFGVFKLSITWPDGIYSPGVNHLSYYWQINNSNASTFSFSTSSTLHHSKIVVYKPNLTDKYNVSTLGELDTYLYIIDPRLTNRTIGSDFSDDDSGSSNNASIVTFLAKNVDYLIIFSHYNLMIEGTYYVVITRNL